MAIFSPETVAKVPTAVGIVDDNDDDIECIYDTLEPNGYVQLVDTSSTGCCVDSAEEHIYEKLLTTVPPSPPMTTNSVDDGGSDYRGSPNFSRNRAKLDKLFEQKESSTATTSIKPQPASRLRKLSESSKPEIPIDKASSSSASYLSPPPKLKMPWPLHLKYKRSNSLPEIVPPPPSKTPQSDLERVAPAPTPLARTDAYVTAAGGNPSTTGDDELFDPDYVIQPRALSRIASPADVPSGDVSGLNCDEVADCLRLLRMSAYCETFLVNQIDGHLLAELDERDLTADLNVSGFHAKKLVMFARLGWRPWAK